MCPACQVTLTVTERHGVEIDVCPTCRGVWLDRGELDKILQREAAFEARGASREPARDRPEAGRGHDDRGPRDRDDDDYRDRGPRGRRRSLWTELFD